MIEDAPHSAALENLQRVDAPTEHLAAADADVLLTDYAAITTHTSYVLDRLLLSSTHTNAP
ncbi:hypothetical protein [Streptomyces sp. NPDC045714]|uniref:hypothetical protein n=1 Tax=Streptomyces sp. NPDC045714 TaxID=3154913 RepID=UPI0033D033FB